MIVYLATPTTIMTYDKSLVNGVHVLETYHAIKNKKDLDWLHTAKSFLLDSGAYTYMRGSADYKSIDWNKYIEEYAAFILRNRIQYYFELDIDAIIGYENVKKLTERLNQIVGYNCIPVWHKTRGLRAYEQMLDDYGYVSISASGNNGSSEWTRTPQGESVLFQLANMAHKKNIKLHALGYTKMERLRQFPLYSVDSTAWVRGIYGSLYMFNGFGIDKIRKPEGTRMIVKNVHSHNFAEWAKFQQYAEKNL